MLGQGVGEAQGIWFKARMESDVGQQAGSDKEPDDVHGLIGEIVALLGGDFGIVRVHLADGTPREIRTGGTDPRWSRLAASSRHSGDSFLAKGWTWHRELEGGASALLLRATVPGQDDVLIEIFFGKPSAAVEVAAERTLRASFRLIASWFELWHRKTDLSRRHRIMADVLDHHEAGLLLIDASGQIHFANLAGREMLAKGDGLGSIHGILRATHLGDGVALAAALSHLSTMTILGTTMRLAAPLLVFHRERAPSLVAALVPVTHSSIEPHGIVAAMHIVDPAINMTAMLLPLCKLLLLSPVEASLACALAAGMTVADAAKTMRVQEQTARGYLKQIFIKTNTRRQTDLVVLILSSILRLRCRIAQFPVTNVTRWADGGPDQG